jgi:hypothetical protein
MVPSKPNSLTRRQGRLISPLSTSIAESLGQCQSIWLRLSLQPPPRVTNVLIRLQDLDEILGIIPVALADEIPVNVEG